MIPVMTDMCYESCVAFAGPFLELHMCPECSLVQYETVTQGNKLMPVPQKQVCYIMAGMIT